MEPDAASAAGRARLENGPAAPALTPGVEAWPEPMGAAAYHGVFGDIVRAMAPETEADPHAILVQLLVMYGSLIGRSAHWRAENDQHYTNLFAVIVGVSGKGRKGVSRRQAQGLFSAIDEAWVREHITSGLSSGEGLLYAVRDAVEKQEAIKGKTGVVTYQDVVVDSGVTDKRLLVVEEEFASTLKVMARDGSTLSALIRQFWDCHETVRTMTRNNPMCATAPHVSIIGHITKDELRRYLDATESANGYGNRHLWVLARRSRSLPEGGNPVDYTTFRAHLERAVAHGQRTGLVGRDRAARLAWHRVYDALSIGRPGLLGAMTSRAEAQVMRLACLYALADGDTVIRLPHLLGGLEVWRYCYDSARFIFGDSLGDRAADDILSALRAEPAGLTLSDISGLFHRHLKSGELSRALQLLSGNGLARSERQPSAVGRPPERWFAVTLPRGEHGARDGMGHLVALAAGAQECEKSESSEESPAPAEGLVSFFAEGRPAPRDSQPAAFDADPTGSSDETVTEQLY